MKDEKEFKQVETILRKIYGLEKYWFDPRLVNETIKAVKQIQKEIPAKELING